MSKLSSHRFCPVIFASEPHSPHKKVPETQVKSFQEGWKSWLCLCMTVRLCVYRRVCVGMITSAHSSLMIGSWACGLIQCALEPVAVTLCEGERRKEKKRERERGKEGKDSCQTPTGTGRTLLYLLSASQRTLFSVLWELYVQFFPL